MKLLIDGVWRSGVEDTPALLLARTEERNRVFRSVVTADGGDGFRAESGRYHLYISYACPWAHRTVLYRRLKGLQDTVSMSVVHPVWGGPNGWEFKDTDLSSRDHVSGVQYLYQVYQAAKPDFTGKVTVPVLWDKKTRTIVNTESGDIIRMLNSEFDAFADASVDFYPQHLRGEIDSLNAVILDRVCKGVYKAGFATTQSSYDQAIVELFETLDDLDNRLSNSDFLIGNRVTESDWHLFATLVRFDAAYHTKLKCSRKRLIDYANLSRYTARLYGLPGVAETTKLGHVKKHYFDDLGFGDPRIILADPEVDFRSVA